MQPSALFSVANTTALVTWIVLVLFQRRTWATTLVVPAVAGLLAAAYLAIVSTMWLSSSGGFSSLAAVGTLFDNPWMLLAGWLHYLAFDLLIGRWAAMDGTRRGLSPWLVAPFLLLTFMFGPAGWLLYCVARRAAAPLPS